MPVFLSLWARFLADLAAGLRRLPSLLELLRASAHKTAAELLVFQVPFSLSRSRLQAGLRPSQMFTKHIPSFLLPPRFRVMASVLPSSHRSSSPGHPGHWMEAEVNGGCLVADLDSEEPQLMMLVLDEQLGVVHRGDLIPDHVFEHARHGASAQP
jgi:hypothetical protein